MGAGRIKRVLALAAVLALALAERPSALAMWGFRLNPVCSAMPSWRDVSGYGFVPARAAENYGLLMGALIICAEIALVELAGLRMLNSMDIAAEP